MGTARNARLSLLQRGWAMLTYLLCCRKRFERTGMRIAGFAVAFLALGSGVAAAPLTDAQVEQRYTRAFSECMATSDAAQGISFAMRECVIAEYERQDDRLNAAYRTVMQRQPDAAAKAKLRTLQRRWIAGRDRLCAGQAAEAGDGTAGPMTMDSCFLAEAVRRTAYLEAYRE